MSCQIAFLGSPQAFAARGGAAGIFPGILPAAVIAGRGGDDGTFPGAKRFSSLKEAFFAFPALEAVAISPSFSGDGEEFYDNASLALSHGKHLFAAIPPSLSSGSIGKLLALAKDAGCLFYPYLPGIASDGFREAKGILARKELGEILLAAEEGVVSGDPLFPEAGFAESLREILLPSFLRLRILFGEVLSVSALAERSGAFRTEGIPRPDAVTAEIRFVSGPICTVFCRSASPEARARLLISGRNGEFSVDLSFDAGSPDNAYDDEFASIPGGDEFDQAFSGFLLALRESEPRDLLPSEALLLPDAVRYADAAVSSALSGGSRVLLPEARF